MKNMVKAFAPATVANLGSGFDIIGAAIDQLGDEVTVRPSTRPEIILKSIKGDNGKLSTNLQENILIYVGELFLKHPKIQRNGAPPGLEFELQKKMPIESGLGSSAASIVAGLVALNEMMNNLLGLRELLHLAFEAEKKAEGVSIGHCDNVAPCLIGGVVIATQLDPLDVVKIPVSKNLDLHFCLIHPNISIKTGESRNNLNEFVELRKVVEQTINISNLIMALRDGDREGISKGLIDSIVTPQRIQSIPHYKLLANEINFLPGNNQKGFGMGLGISGSGPTLFILCDGRDEAVSVQEKCSILFAKEKLVTNFHISKINFKGPHIISSEG